MNIDDIDKFSIRKELQILMNDQTNEKADVETEFFGKDRPYSERSGSGIARTGKEIQPPTVQKLPEAPDISHACSQSDCTVTLQNTCLLITWRVHWLEFH